MSAPLPSFLAPLATLDTVTTQLWGLFAAYGGVVYAGLLIFARAVAYMHLAPIFNRKDFPMLIKIVTAMFITIVMVWIVPYDRQAFSINQANGTFMIQLMMNVLIGAMMGFLSDMVMQAAYAGGQLLATQMGLNMAMTMDPSLRRQTSIMETLTIYMTIMIFMEMGGFHLIITTFKHSFDVMPLFSTSPNIFSVLKMETFLTLSGSAIEIAVQLMASIMVFTMAFDIILALVNRTAQQIPVYQLGMALKPLFTLGLFLVIMQMFNNSLHRHLEMYRTLF